MNSVPVDRTLTSDEKNLVDESNNAVQDLLDKDDTIAQLESEAESMSLEDVDKELLDDLEC